MLSEHRFQPIGSPRSFELVIREMRRAIVRGDLRPREKLPAEPELAAQFGVSRSALREALKVLEVSGYLEVRRGYGGGTFVSAPDPEEFTAIPSTPVPALSLTPRQVLEVRLAIEPRAARLAATAPLGDALDLWETIRHMEVFDDRPAQILAAAVDFHVAVSEAAQNPVFVTVIRDLRPAMYRAMNRFVREADWRQVCRGEHEFIAKEIQRGDPDRAERAMRQHLTKGEEGDGA